MLNDPLLRFAQNSQRPRLSLYFPTHRAGPETRQDPIRLRNLLREGRNQLVAQGMAENDVEKMLSPLHDLDHDIDFWRHQQEGLGILVAPDGHRVYKLPYSVPELVVAGEEFHLKPLLSLFAHDDHFHLIALSKSHTQVYEGNRYSLRSVTIPNMPTSLAEALQFDDGELQIQQHTSGPKGQAGHTIFHGQGGEKEVHPDQLLRYFRAINKAFREHVKDSKLPLVLAGVGYYFPIFREVNSYQHLLEEGVTGAIESMSEKELHDSAWRIVEPRLINAQDKALERFNFMANGNNGNGVLKIADKVEPAVIAAFEGRVDALIIPEGRQIWGEFHADTETVKMKTDDSGNRCDLLDVAAVNTLLHGGEVYVVPQDKMPEGRDIAALLRFEAA